MESKQGKYIVLEGINGCGKRTVAKEFGQILTHTGMRGFDLVDYWLTHKDYPVPEDLMEYDFLLSSEPTHGWIGRAIRKEMFYDNGRNYSEKSMLNAFALDRHILARRLTVPLRKAGKHIFQERSFATGLIQQARKGSDVTWDDILNHPDHQLILENLPDMILVVDIDPHFAAELMGKRPEEEKDHDVYEELERQKEFAERYRSEEFRKLFEDRGVEVKYIKNDSDPKGLIDQATKVFEDLMEL